MAARPGAVRRALDALARTPGATNDTELGRMYDQAINEIDDLNRQLISHKHRIMDLSNERVLLWKALHDAGITEVHHVPEGDQ